MLFAKTIVIIFSIILIVFTISPMGSAIIYLLARPLVQPYASLGYVFTGSIPMTSTLPIILIFSAFFNLIIHKKYLVVSLNIIPLYLLLYISVLSFYNTPSYFISIGHCIKIFTAISLYILIYNAVKSKIDIHRILWAYLICTIIPMFYGYYQFCTSTGGAWKGYRYAGRRIDSLLMEFNAYGEFLCIAICAGLMLMLISNTLRRKLVIGTILFSLFLSLVLSLNRGSWICFLFALIFASFFYRRTINIKLVFGLSFIALLVASPFIYQRFIELSVVTEFGSKNTLINRIEGWKALFPIFMKHPILGNGIGAIQLTLSSELRLSYVPHNDYIRLATEGGFMALLAYIWFQVGNLFRNISKSRYLVWQINYPLLVAIIYFATLSFFQNIIYNVVVFPMFTGLLALGHKAHILAHIETASSQKEDHAFV